MWMIGKIACSFLCCVGVKIKLEVFVKKKKEALLIGNSVACGI